MLRRRQSIDCVVIRFADIDADGWHGAFVGQAVDGRRNGKVRHRHMVEPIVFLETRHFRCRLICVCVLLFRCYVLSYLKLWCFLVYDNEMWYVWCWSVC